MLAFTSCDNSSIVNSKQDAITSFDNIAEMTASQVERLDPKEISDAYFKMVEEVQQMSIEELENLSSEDLNILGKPLLDATSNSVKYSHETLHELNKALSDLATSIRTITREEHARISRGVAQIIAADESRTTRNLNTENVLGILLNINGGATTMSSSCETMFNHWGGYIHLYPGDNLNIANDLCPAGSIFYVHTGSGNYDYEYVNNSKDGNYWLGAGGVPILDGKDSRSKAFNGGMKNNIIAFLEIQDYKDYGIYSTSTASSNIEISYMTFRNIAGDRFGSQFFGAIYFKNVNDVLIQNSYFNNVTHSIRFNNSNGPIQVLNNEALNTGFGFFQCIDCEGSNIKINSNSLEHSSQYGDDPLRDFINIFKSEGSNSSNRIQVNNNRARINLVSGNASGVSDTGCFIILGDIGGEYQEAKNNIGVNPGNCGIGTAGGEYFKVENNKIFSQRINGISNVGIYAQK